MNYDTKGSKPSHLYLHSCHSLWFQRLKDVVTFAGKEYLVSTVQLTDTAMTFDRLLFGMSDIQRYETMIFAYNNGDLDYIDFYCERYDTKEEAIKGHNEIRKGRKDAWAEVVSNEK